MTASRCVAQTIQTLTHSAMGLTVARSQSRLLTESGEKERAAAQCVGPFSHSSFFRDLCKAQTYCIPDVKPSSAEDECSINSG